MDPATRGWMSASGGYIEPLPLGGPVMGVTVGKVVESRNPQIQPGLTVAGVGPRAKYMIAGPEQIRRCGPVSLACLRRWTHQPGTS
jgi:NADPH-dependent curcumin reductase CurA